MLLRIIGNLYICSVCLFLLLQVLHTKADPGLVLLNSYLSPMEK